MLIIAAHAQENIILDGEHVKLVSVSVKGNTAFDNSDILSRLQSQPTASIFTKVITAFTTPPSYVSAVSLIQDSITIVDLYRDRGYLFADVRYAVTIDTPKVTAEVTFAIIEGKQCMVDSVDLQVTGHVSPEELAVLKGVSSKLLGHPYSKFALRDSLNSAMTYLQNHGYRFARLVSNPVVRLNPSLTSVTVTVNIDPGQLYRFGKVEIVYDSSSAGLCFAENAVLFELEFHDGELYSRTKVYRTEDNLRRLGVFEIVRIELLTASVDTATRIAPTRVFLKLRRQIDFSPDFIASNEGGQPNIGATMTIAHHNIFCAAQELSLSLLGQVPLIDGKFAFNNSRIDVYMKFFQPRVRLGDILDYRRTSLQALAGYSRISYPINQKKYTASIQLSIREADYTYLVPQIAFVQVQTDTAGLGQSGLISTTEIISKQPNLLLSISLTRDNTNNIFVPTEGSSGVLTLKTNVLNTPHFGKVEATQKWYVPWGTQSVFAFRLHGGLIGRFGDREKDILFEEKFYVGGAYSVRGWGLYELGYGIPDSIKTGYTLFEANAEWRYQWFRLPDSWITRVILNRISTSFFIDAGQIWSERRASAWVPDMWKQVAVAIGVGFRYDTPVGPIRIDLGYKFYDPVAGDFVHLASFDRAWPFIRLAHPIVQLAIGNAF